MNLSSFTDRSYRVDRAANGVVCDTVARRDDLEALRDAIAWRRDELAAEPMDGSGAVLSLRAVIALHDLLGETTAYESEALVSVGRDQVRLLCEIASAYVAERDVDSYQAPEERERIASLRGLSGPLMDTCCELAAAEDEAADKALLAR
jgi:hypothetical protein